LNKSSSRFEATARRTYAGCECRQLRLGGKPALDQEQVRIELGWHANPSLVTPFGPAVRCTRLNGCCALHAEAFRKCRCIRWSWLRRWSCGSPSTAVNASTEFLLSGSNLSQQQPGRAKLRAQALLDCFVQLWMPCCLI